MITTRLTYFSFLDISRENQRTKTFRIPECLPSVSVERGDRGYVEDGRYDYDVPEGFTDRQVRRPETIHGKEDGPYGREGGEDVELQELPGYGR